MLTEERLREIEARARQATPGPWLVEESGLEPGSYAVSSPGREPRLRFSGWTEMLTAHGNDDEPVMGARVAELNAEFVAHAREDVPALIAEIRRLQHDLVEAWQALGPAWLFGGVSLAEGIRRKTAAMKRLGMER